MILWFRLECTNKVKKYTDTNHWNIHVFFKKRGLFQIHTFRLLSSASDFHTSHALVACKIWSSHGVDRCFVVWFTKSSRKRWISLKLELFKIDGDIEYCLLCKLFSNNGFPIEPVESSSRIGLISDSLLLWIV